MQDPDTCHLTGLEPRFSKKGRQKQSEGKTPTDEYLLVTDKDSKILKSSADYYDLKNMANLIRAGGGEVTIFKSTKG